MQPLHKNISYHKFREDLDLGRTSCHNMVKQCLQRIHDSSHLNIVIQSFDGEALSRAAEIDQKLREGRAGKLAGMLVGIKDNLLFKGHEVTAASGMLQGFEAIYMATVLQRLLDEDAIIIARFNCDEFAMGSSNERSFYGACKNPADPTRVPGGSSGGSAAAVKAGLCMVSLGSDTGGSIRQPAAFCGVVGLKPGYGTVSRYGLVNYTSSFDQIGPLANDVRDVALTLEVMAGADGKDHTLSRKSVPVFSQLLQCDKKFKLAVFKDAMERDGLDPEIKTLFLQWLKNLEKDGHQVDFIEFGFLDYLLPAYAILTAAEASSNLARYDGIHYHKSSAEFSDIRARITTSRSQGFGAEPKRKIMLGKFVLEAENKELYYQKAQKLRRIFKNRVDEIFSEYDFIASPTTPTTAFEIGQIQDVIVMYLQDIFTTLANHTGNPAISLPLLQHSNGLPVGVQLMCNKFDEKTLLAFSHLLMETEK
jgi:aspartyl-tRNA(Asn)/glutamyl-tRNA(Gln) amidotransferase subunit A